MTTAQFIGSKIISILLVVFTYAIPLISSIRAVHHRDKGSFQQWLTYYLLIFLLTPLFDIIRVHPIFRLAVVIWLSLPKFQGALFVYNEVFDVAMEKYGVEDKVDQKIEHVKTTVKDSMWRIAKDIGWSALSQVGEFVTFVQESASSYNEGVVQNSQNTGGAGADIAQGQGLRMKKHYSSESLLSRKPSHSVQEGMSSFSSVEAISDVVEQEAYAADFISMLKEGLYVFAAHNDPADENLCTAEDSSTKRFRLRVFFYESDDESSAHAGADADAEPYFVLHPVENNAENVHDDIEIISVADVKEIRQSGTNAIAFIGIGRLESELPSIIVNSESETSLIQTMISASSATVNTVIPEGAEIQSDGTRTCTSTGNERVIAEIVLSNADDRETLFQGMKFCFKEFSQLHPQSNKETGVDPVGSGTSTRSGDSSLHLSDHNAELVDWNSDPNLENHDRFPKDESVENDDGDGECTGSRHDYDGHVDDEPTAGADLVKQSIDSGDEYEKGSNVTSVEDMDMDVVKAIDDENDGVCDIEMRITNDMDSSIGGELESLVTIRSEDVDK